MLMLRTKTLLLVPVLALAFAGCGGGGGDVPAATGGSGGSADTTPPTNPTNLTASAAGSTAVDLSWQTSTDNVGVVGYGVERCQGAGCSTFAQVATPTGTSFTDTGLAAATSYIYRVRAADAATNISAYSNVASATTAPATSDTSPPTAPANLVATAVGEGQIDLAWTASTDNVGVTGYRLERCQGAACTNFTEISVPSASPYSDTSSLLPSTTYRYRVRATDGAGNLSGFSSTANATTQAASGTTLQLGALVHDGPATPEQISLILPVTGALPQTATASVRYKPTGSSTWITGHPLYRIRPDLALTPAAGSVPDAFAWPIVDVAPGTSYDVEVTVNSGAVSNVKTLTHTTRELPAPAGPVTTTIAAGSTSAQIQAAIDNLIPGNVIQFQNGTYTLTNNLVLNRSGTLANPIYIRGESRTGVVLSNPSRIFQIQNASHVIIENMSLQGSGVDSGTAVSSKGIVFYDGTPNQTRITVRNVTMNGVDSAIGANAEIREFLAYDNTFNGNNTWIPALIDTNATWNDDGIRVPGFGNCVFNNTLKGFGDTMSYSQSSGGVGIAQAIGVHFYRNDVLMGGDDGTEVDDGHRNLTFYDNRMRNTMTFISLDPLFGGPFVAARNIAINTGRGPFKFNNQNAGQFIYNNTIIRTNGRIAGWGSIQFNDGPQRSWGHRNNLLVYRGSGNLLAWEPGINNPIDFTHNSWFPNAAVWWTNSGGSFAGIAAAFAGLPATAPVFSGATQRHAQDNITISNPWTSTVTLGGDYLTEVMVAYTPALSPGTVPKNSGVVIPNITDGFTGGAPDRGAIIEGRPIPQYGDRSP